MRSSFHFAKHIESKKLFINNNFIFIKSDYGSVKIEYEYAEAKERVN